MNNREYLFCFTYAGGTSSFFDKLDNALDNRVELIKLEYSGHGKRCKEPFYSSFEDLSKDLFPKIKEIIYKEQIEKYMPKDLYVKIFTKVEKECVDNEKNGLYLYKWMERI